MNKDKAKEITRITNGIERLEGFLSSLDGHSYNDEYVIYYRGMETCELEDEARLLLVNHYKSQIKKLVDELSRF